MVLRLSYHAIMGEETVKLHCDDK